MQQQSVLTVPRPTPLVLVPPPFLFAAAFGAGALLDHFLPLPRAAMPSAVYWGGAALVVAGLGFGLWLAVSFLFRRTTLKPFADPAVLVTAGAYRISRNPMYLSLIVIYVGAALMFGSAWPLAMLVAPVAILMRFVIPFEEERMRAAFGARYRDYRARVRRWL